MVAPVGPAWAQDILEWPGNMILRPFNPIIYADNLVGLQNKTGTRTYAVRVALAGPPVTSACGTNTIAGFDASFTVTITAGTPGTCVVTLAGVYTVAPKCWYGDETTANANGGRCATTLSGSTATLTITPPTFTGAAANFGADKLNVRVEQQV